MPLYEYECQDCQDTFVDQLPIAERNAPCEAKCIKCGGQLFRKCGNNGGFQLVGDGWERDGYATHYGDTPEFKKRFGGGR